MTTAYIFGNGGHAKVVASLLEDTHSSFEFVTVNGDRNTISEEKFFAKPPKNASIYIGIGDNAIRTKLYLRLLDLGLQPATCIGKNTFIASSAQVDSGAVICPGSVIMAHSHVGINTIVNTLSSVDHDCLLGAHSQLTANVTLGGETKIGKNCFLGIKSATIPQISIGDNSIVMAGSLVTKSLPNDVLAGGSPASIMRKI